MDPINEMTLEYLMNREQYEKYLSSKVLSKDFKKRNEKDKKFYKKRILDMVRQLLQEEGAMDMNPEIVVLFDLFVKECIHTFKNIDKTDILQEEYKHLADDIPVVFMAQKPDTYMENKEVVDMKFRSFDKFMFYFCELNFHPKKIMYSYNFGAEYPDKVEPEKLYDDFYIAIFNTSGINEGKEIHETTGWARDYWESSF
jgi:hypothetical protein